MTDFFLIEPFTYLFFNLGSFSQRSEVRPEAEIMYVASVAFYWFQPLSYDYHWPFPEYV